MHVVEHVCTTQIMTGNKSFDVLMLRRVRVALGHTEARLSETP